MWWYQHAILAYRKTVKEKDCEFEASLWDPVQTLFFKKKVRVGLASLQKSRYWLQKPAVGS